MDLAHFWNTSGGYEIKQSLRFNSADSAYLNRTPASAGNRKTYTISMWVKRGKLGATARLFGSYSSSNVFFEAAFDSNDNLYWYYYTYPGISYQRTTSQVFRDPSAWMHLVFAFDSTNATAADRMKIYVNGQQITTFSTTVNPTQNFDCLWNSTSNNVLGDMLYNNAPGSSFNGYIAEVYNIDGTALTPSSFGETNTITGAWIPKKYSGSYGTNGFYLNFSDNSGTTSTTLGKDSSGNGNNWTPNNFSVTAGAGNDVMSDTPTNNWCTLNPLDTHAVAALTDGNLAITGQSASKNGLGTIAVNNGKWYYEAQYTTAPSTNSGIGVATIGTWSNMSDMDSTPSGIRYRDNGVIYQNGASQGTFASYTTNDIIGVAFDCDNGQISFYKNNTLQATLTGVTALQNNSITACLYNYAGNMAVNFGQRAFAYTPPTGFKALNTANLPEPTIKKGSKYFDTKLYTGNGGTQAISGLSFSPDLVWIKARSVGYNHQLQDTVRGAGKELQSDLTGAETSYGLVSAFNSDGFTVFTNGTYLASNQNGTTYAAWCWDANGAGSSNTAGTITSTVSANPTAGFSIVTYTGTLSSTPGTAPTVGHGLGVAPSLIISKSRNPNGDDSGAWYVNHVYDHTRYLRLSSTASAVTIASQNGGTAVAPTSTVFSTYYIVGSNTASNNYVAYCFSEVAGYSKFGSYTGNGSTDGPFVFCGFRPRWVMIKRTNSTGNWYLYDTARETYNVMFNDLCANLLNAENVTINTDIDVVSNGFKLRGPDGDVNFSGHNYIFAAFAESPFKYSLAR